MKKICRITAVLCILLLAVFAFAACKPNAGKHVSKLAKKGGYTIEYVVYSNDDKEDADLGERANLMAFNEKSKSGIVAFYYDSKDELNANWKELKAYLTEVKSSYARNYNLKNIVIGQKGSMAYVATSDVVKLLGIK